MLASSLADRWGGGGWGERLTGRDGNEGLPVCVCVCAYVRVCGCGGEGNNVRRVLCIVSCTALSASQMYSHSAH